jgi:hypothetical protein
MRTSNILVWPLKPNNVCIGIDIFVVNGHIFFMTNSRKICLTTITHLINHKVCEVWAVMYKIYQMYMLCRFHIVEIAGEREFAWITDQVASLPTTPILNLAAASKHVGLVERNIRFLKEKTCLIRHSLPFERILALMLVRMVFIVNYPSIQLDTCMYPSSQSPLPGYYNLPFHSY